MTTAPVFLRSANLNLVPILRTLLREVSVSRAAEVLGMSQSATSGALANLRLLLDDPLLVQVGRGMQLTPRAKALALPLERVCGDLERLLRDAPFDPAASDRNFVIATPDYVALLVGPGLVDSLRSAAPGVTVQFIDLPSNYAAQLASGDVDVVIIALSEQTPETLSVGPPLQDGMVLVTRLGHPLQSVAEPTQADMDSYPQAYWLPGLDKEWRNSRRALGLPNGARPMLNLQHFTVMPLLALETDCIVHVPRTLAERMARLAPLRILNSPTVGRSIPTAVVWSPVHDADAAHRWFRDLASAALHRAAPAP